MRYGIYLPNFGSYGDARVLADLARDAEQAGWDGFFIWDHIATEEHLPMVDPWVGLTAVALATSRILLGTSVTPLPRRRPWKLARETVSLDRLSGGRFILGVGIGLGHDEWDDLGEESDQRVRGAMLDEGLDVLTGLWSGESFSYDGAYYTVKEAVFLPTPLQQPRIPIWVAGFWPNKPPFRRAARWDGIFPLFSDWNATPERLAEVLAYIRAHRTSTMPFNVVAMGTTPDATSAESRATVEAYAAVGATWWLELLSPYRFGKEDRELPWPVEQLRERVMQGPPKLA
jgi:probable F420-dependent oxidoreductase